jgi:hypothetical protein
VTSARAATPSRIACLDPHTSVVTGHAPHKASRAVGISTAFADLLPDWPRGRPRTPVVAPASRLSRAIDLRTDRHPLASVGTLVLGLRCSWCPAAAPMPRPIGLFALPPARRADTSYKYTCNCIYL